MVPTDLEIAASIICKSGRLYHFNRDEYPSTEVSLCTRCILYLQGIARFQVTRLRHSSTFHFQCLSPFVVVELKFLQLAFDFRELKYRHHGQIKSHLPTGTCASAWRTRPCLRRWLGESSSGTSTSTCDLVTDGSRQPLSDPNSPAHGNLRRGGDCGAL
jgi:hypothetical protein